MSQHRFRQWATVAVFALCLAGAWYYYAPMMDKQINRWSDFKVYRDAMCRSYDPYNSVNPMWVYADGLSMFWISSILVSVETGIRINYWLIALACATLGAIATWRWITHAPVATVLLMCLYGYGVYHTLMAGNVGAFLALAATTYPGAFAAGCFKPYLFACVLILAALRQDRRNG